MKRSLLVGALGSVVLLWGCGKSVRNGLTGTVTGLFCGGGQIRDTSALDPRFSQKVLPVMDELREAGFDFQVSSVYRSPKLQECLYDLSQHIQNATGRNGLTQTKRSCHNNVRDGQPASLAIDLHLYGESEETTVDFYKQLRRKATKVGLESGGNWKRSNPKWAKHDLGWDPGHVQVRRCSSKLKVQ